MRKRSSLAVTGMMALLLLGNCGGGADLSVILSTQFPLDSFSRIRLVVFDSQITCSELMEDPAATAALPLCATQDSEESCVLTHVSISDPKSSPVLFVPEGTLLLFGAGYDSEGEVTASGCEGPLEIVAGQTTEVELALR